METSELLYIAFILYLTIMAFAFVFQQKWLLLLSGLLWFIPITVVDNMFIIIISSVMLIAHFILGFYNKTESEF